jgi:hypothetical protein
MSRTKETPEYKKAFGIDDTNEDDERKSAFEHFLSIVADSMDGHIKIDGLPPARGEDIPDVRASVDRDALRAVLIDEMPVLLKKMWAIKDAR